jgi:hypothetical protein
MESLNQTYRITKEINLFHTTDDFGYCFTADECGTVCITETQGLEAMTGTTTHLHVPKDCIPHFIKALESFSVDKA